MHLDDTAAPAGNTAYEAPQVIDYGTLTDMTAALHGGGPEDGSAKALIHISLVIVP